MRIIFESPRAPAVCTLPDGVTSPTFEGSARGVAWLVVRAFDPGEMIPNVHDHARPVLSLTARLAPGEPYVVEPPAEFTGDIARIAVPRAVLEVLDADTIVGVDWEFVPQGD